MIRGSFWGGEGGGFGPPRISDPRTIYCTPTTGLRERGNDTSKSTGRSGQQKAATRRNMRREERVTVQGPVKEQQPDGMSHRGGPTHNPWGGPRTPVRPPCGANHADHYAGAHATRVNHKGAHDTCGNHVGARNAQVRYVQGWRNWSPRTQQHGEADGGQPGQQVEGWSTTAARTRKHVEACGGRLECRGE